jgi:Aspartyl protease
MSKLVIALSTLIAISALWAVPLAGTAHQSFWKTEERIEGIPIAAPVRLRGSENRGLLADLWISGSGPYTFAIDTGAGVSLVSRDLVTRAKLQTRRSSVTLVGGLSSGSINSNQSTTVNQFALGARNNELRTSFTAAVVPSLPDGLDGILDPTEAFRPFGYSIDLPNRELRVVDFNSRGLQLSDVPSDGAVVKWIRKGNDHRPFVRLGDGRLALIDTGSNFGLAVSDGPVVGINPERQNRIVRDLGGGSISARRVSPVTVNIGSLVLQRVPTDVLFGAPSGTPVILGRDALYPFRLTFDPTTRLIQLAPVEQ